MASLEEAQKKMVFLSVFEGKFAQRVKKDSAGSVERATKSGKVVYEKYYSSAAGIITKLEIRSNEYDGKTFKSLNITLDNEVKIQLSGGIDNYQNKSIINTLLSPELDITRKLVFVVSKTKDGYSEVFIMQDDHGIKRFSSKNNLNGVPQPKEKESMGEKVWDWSEQNEWYYKKFNELSEKVKSNIANQELDNKISNQQESTPTDEEKDERETTVDDFPSNPKKSEPAESPTDAELVEQIEQEKKEKKDKAEEEVNPDDIPF